QKQKQNRESARDTLYHKILSNTLDDAHNSVEKAQRRTERAKGGSGKQRKQSHAIHVVSGSSESDSDSLCARSELKEMTEKMKMWKPKAAEMKEEHDFLRERITTLERCLESKIFEFLSIPSLSRESIEAGEQGIEEQATGVQDSGELEETQAELHICTAMVKHWGLKTGEDVNITVDSINRLLMEKIQDVLKSKRRTEGQ
ncbi:hypothetical protein MTO96_021868, partial [Rhipicephalus appendiculatus]